MRTIFSTKPVPATHQSTLGGRNVGLRGNTHLEVVAFDAGEQVPQGYHPEPLAGWLRGLGPGEPLRLPPPGTLTGIGEVLVPRQLLDALPGDSLLTPRWVTEQ